MRLAPVAVVWLAATAAAAGAQTTDVIHACAHRSNGKLRIVAAAGQCKNAEVGISWNAAGPPGPPAPSPAAINFVGFSSTTFAGSAGLLAFADACRSSFTGSHQCTSEELVASSAPVAATGLAWVRPEIVDGVDAGSGKVNHTNLTCGEWTNGSADALGLVVVFGSTASHAPSLAPYSGFLTERCNVSLPVACCTPPE